MRGKPDPGRRNAIGSVALLSGCALAPMHGVARAAQQEGDQAPNAQEPITQPSRPSPEGFIRRARELAGVSLRRGDGTGYGAIVVKNDTIVGEGRNRTIVTNDPTAHSEVDAIRDACRRLGVPTLEGCQIYCSAKPCPMCRSACYWAGIEAVYYPAGESELASYEPRYAAC